MERPQLIQGRLIRPEDVERMRRWLEAHPESNRTGLSRELCAWWNWRNGVGRLKDMAARSLLLKLEAQGHLQLPARRTASVNGRRNRQLFSIDHDQRVVVGALEGVRPVRVEPVIEGTAQGRLFQFLLQSYHYLGHRNCVGENLKYLACDRAGRPLACLLFGSAAWKAAARDRWIGWSDEQRRRHLPRVTNNTRFTILPWVRVAHLASHLLGRVTARLSEDWQQKYGHPIELVETFVEQPRFAGHCYRAAGWIPVGLTTGRTRNHDGMAPKAPIKSIWVKPLTPEARRRLAA
jgi:hypothetical protein